MASPMLLIIPIEWLHFKASMSGVLLLCFAFRGMGSWMGPLARLRVLAVGLWGSVGRWKASADGDYFKQKAEWRQARNHTAEVLGEQQ